MGIEGEQGEEPVWLRVSSSELGVLARVAAAVAAAVAHSAVECVGFARASFSQREVARSCHGGCE